MDRREIDRRLRKIGAIRIRTTGGHEIWRLPNGYSFPVPCHAKAWKAGRGRFSVERKLLKQLDSLQRGNHAYRDPEKLVLSDM